MPDHALEILIDCNPFQTRVAVLENGRAAELFFERPRKHGAVGDIYLGQVSRVLPGMQAAFVEIGLEKDAFLYVADVRDDWEGYDDGPAEEDVSPRPTTSIDELLKEGQSIIVQVVKEAMGAKGARVSTNISLPGRLLVYTPYSAKAGISRRIEDETERERLREALEAFPGGRGFIARTAAQGRGVEEFETDRVYLSALWESILARSRSSQPPALLHGEQDLILRSLRDLVSEDIAAVRVNDHEAFGRIVEFLHVIEPSAVSRVRLHQSNFLFEEFGVEAEIEKALKSKVWLKSGGYLVINPTEALVSIDVNTGKFVGTDNLEETVLAVNLEAVREIVRQIRLRDLGGILVVDFIDLEDEGHRRALFEAFETEMKKDRAKSKILQISEFGLVQVTRKRSRPSLERALTRPCPCCGGNGRVKSDMTVALEIRREILKLSRSLTAGETILVRSTPEVAKALRGTDKGILDDVEKELEISIVIREDDTLSAAHYEIAAV
ncbi:MAG: Rne/Rng family ribonuclease [Thermoanaerobaculia bacterium]